MNQGGQQASNSHLIDIWEMQIFHFCPTETTKISYDLMAILKKHTFSMLCPSRKASQTNHRIPPEWMSTPNWLTSIASATSRAPWHCLVVVTCCLIVSRAAKSKKQQNVDKHTSTLVLDGLTVSSKLSSFGKGGSARINFK